MRLWRCSARRLRSALRPSSVHVLPIRGLPARSILAVWAGGHGGRGAQQICATHLRANWQCT
eukprot:9796875-Lingulodinium_polyedra.AAC.1